jgi:hypothetical protein
MATTKKDISTELTKEIIQWLHSDLDLTYGTIASAIDADRSTLNRWANRKYAPSKSHYEKIMELQRIKTLMEKSFPDQEARRKWIHYPIEGSQGKSPLQLLKESSLDPIIEVLASGVTGTFT